MKSKTKLSKQHVLALTALGIVYGDIGTSPLYAFRECFNGKHDTTLSHENVLGILSLIFWSLILVISLKYLFIVMKADHHGEGGVLALMQSALTNQKNKSVNAIFILAIGLFGAALLYGDGILTPAISVLSAVEGLELINSDFQSLVVPVTVVILILLFAGQRFGTAKVGMLFGPIMLIWFIMLGLLGIWQIVHFPAILKALNPAYAFTFLFDKGMSSLFVMGAVFLTVTGGEALYADMGHFGKKAIRQAWFFLVLPGLLLNYFGQGALLLNNKEAIANPFFFLISKSWLYPLVIFSTLATIIASQAIISGAFSLTYQAIQLKYLPRFKVVHTSASEIGQVYLPQINQILLLLTVLVVLMFRSSANLAVAYGIAITVTMIITDLLLFYVMRSQWKWSVFSIILLILLFILVDSVFFAANSLKIIKGGWFPLSMAGLIFAIFKVWMNESAKLKNKLKPFQLPVSKFLSFFERKNFFPAKQTSVYLNEDNTHTPSALLHNLVHNQVIHNRVIFLEIDFNTKPRVKEEDRMAVEELGQEFYRVNMNYGYIENVDMENILEFWKSKKFITAVEQEKMTFFITKEYLVDHSSNALHKIRTALFNFLQKSHQDVMSYYNIPTDKVFEIGKMVEIK